MFLSIAFKDMFICLQKLRDCSKETSKYIQVATTAQKSLLHYIFPNNKYKHSYQWLWPANIFLSLHANPMFVELNQSMKVTN